MKPIPVLLSIAALSAALAAPAPAAVNVNRSGSENPMQEVAKSVIYGGAAGLILGGAVALVDDGGNDADQIKWGFAGGAFFGFGFGLYHVLSRPSASAMIEIEDGRARLGFAAPSLDRRAGLRLALVRAKF
jgi:hypothetical protein